MHNINAGHAMRQFIALRLDCSDCSNDMRKPNPCIELLQSAAFRLFQRHA